MSLPSKWIKQPSDVSSFVTSPAYEKIILYVNACANAVKGQRRSSADDIARRWAQEGEEGSSPPFARWMVPLRRLFQELRQAVATIPLHDMKNQRFGNKAFRDFHSWMDEHMSSLIAPIVASLSVPHSGISPEAMVDELRGYLKDSFGNGSRLDYGTGHELHFFMFLSICLERNGVMDLPDSDQCALLQVTVLNLFWDYIEFMRLVQAHYKLEPAGSHGVYGLDDYHHLSFIFGAAQLADADSRKESPILPKHVTEAKPVEEHRTEYLYFANIAWIRENKRGPFHEHSSMLYNISGIDEWSRIAAGMIKMYDGEVLTKFNVVQHLLFGIHFPPPVSLPSPPST